MKINADFEAVVHLRTADIPWVSSPMKGVDRRMLYREGGEVAKATSIVRYAAGSAFAAHIHHGGEEFLVLDGIFSDEHGDYPAGWYVRNPVGSKHTPSSQGGCTILVSLWQMHPGDQDYVRVDTQNPESHLVSDSAANQLRLHQHLDEEVIFLNWHTDGTSQLNFNAAKGYAADAGKDYILEIFVVSTPDTIILDSEKTCLKSGDWYRQAWLSQEIRLQAEKGTQLLIKRSLQLQDPPIGA